MSIQLKIILAVVLLIYLFFILKAVKKKNLRIGYLIFWSITGIILLIALIVPNFIEFFSKTMGFEMPINMIFSVAIFIILYLLFSITALISNENKNNVLLTQEISILKKRVQELENKDKDKNNK